MFHRITCQASVLRNRDVTQPVTNPLRPGLPGLRVLPGFLGCLLHPLFRPSVQSADPLCSIRIRQRQRPDHLLTLREILTDPLDRRVAFG